MFSQPDRRSGYIAECWPARGSFHERSVGDWQRISTLRATQPIILAAIELPGERGLQRLKVGAHQLDRLRRRFSLREGKGPPWSRVVGVAGDDVDVQMGTALPRMS
jgi:hypothetical protein